MTTRAGDDGLRRSDPTMTPREFNGSSAAPAAENTWAAWVESQIENHASATVEAMGTAIGEVTGPLERRLKELELKLATALGALDVLRGKGMPGSFNFKGTFNNKSSYNHLDVVTHDSSSFVALRDNPGPCPGSAWQMIACGGKRGPAGERGPAGPAAPPLRWVDTGLNFRDGVAIEARASDGTTSRMTLFKTITVDAADFTLKFVGADGSTLKVNLLPLFKRFQEETRP